MKPPKRQELHRPGFERILQNFYEIKEALLKLAAKFPHDGNPKNFTPHPLVYGGQLQTILGYVLSHEKPRKADHRLTHQLEDGDLIAIDVNEPPKAEGHESERPYVLLMHGLGGCSDSPYLIRLSQKLNRMGVSCLRMNHRGAGSEPLAANGIYHSGSMADLVSVMRSLNTKWPRRPAIVVGFSISATILLNAISKMREDCLELQNWKYSIAVCPPLDLEKSSQKITKWFNIHFDKFYTKALIKHCARRYPQIYEERIEGKNYEKWNLRDFDEEVTAPVGGFRDRSHYYRDCSPGEHLAKILMPTSLLLAKDDPVVSSYSREDLRVAKDTEVTVCSSGGHMGFLSKYPTSWEDRHWMDEFICDRIARLFCLKSAH